MRGKLPGCTDAHRLVNWIADVHIARLHARQYTEETHKHGNAHLKIYSKGDLLVFVAVKLAGICLGGGPLFKGF